MRILREVVVFLFYLGLTIAFTWPLASTLNTAVADRGDPLYTAFVIDWVCHALTTAPLRLFDAPIFYPAKYPLAFSEHLTGLAVLVLPFHLAGMGPIAIHNIALLLSFALSGYGAYVLARVVTGRIAPSLAAGVFYAFVPFKFDHLTHLQMLASGWLPLSLAALIVFWRTGRPIHAALLGMALVMNGLSNVYYMLFGGFAIAMSILLLAIVDPRADPAFRRRLALALGGTVVVLLPFLLPYHAVSREYRMRRTSQESARSSATVRDWLKAAPSSALYSRLAEGGHYERRVFPGVLAVALALVGAFLTKGGPSPAASRHPLPQGEGGQASDLPLPLAGEGGRRPGEGPPNRPHLRKITLRIAALIFAILGVILAAADRVTIGGVSFAGSDVPFTLAVVFAMASLPLRELIRRSRFPPALWLALLWIAIGFLGSLGENSFLHSFLFRVVEPFRATRAPARWAVIAYAGLALWMAWGVMQLQRRFGLVAGIAALAASIGEMVPRIRWSHFPEHYGPAYHWLAAARPGAAIELPIGWNSAEIEYVYATTLHRVPIMNGVSGFDPPLHRTLSALPYDDAMLDLIAGNGATVAIIHPAAAERARPWIASGRLRLLASFGDGSAAYAIKSPLPSGAGRPRNGRD